MEIMSVDAANKLLVPNKKTVFVTGVTGQDGSFMVDYLLKNTDFNVIGGARRLSVHNHANLIHLVGDDRFKLVNFDLTDAHSISHIVSIIKPSYFINLAAQSFVKSSWDFPVQTWDTNTTGVLDILEAIRQHCPECSFYNAGSSEEFGDVIYSLQDETHPMRPRSPYGASKVAARQLVKVYRESYNLYAVQCWLFNHEGTRRGEEFVSRKITKGVARVYKSITSPFGEIIPLELGNLDALRDWSDAEDMVDAIWKMVNQELFNYKLAYSARNIVLKNLQEYVVASGEAHSIREFVELAFEGVGIKGKWEGSGLNEIYRYVDGPVSSEKIEGTLVRVNSSFYRPAEVKELRGNSNKIRKELGWQPKTDFKHLVAKMVAHDMEEAGLGGDFYRMHVNSPGTK